MQVLEKLRIIQLVPRYCWEVFDNIIKLVTASDHEASCLVQILNYALLRVDLTWTGWLV